MADANGVPVITSGLVESSQQEIDEVVRLITKRAAGFTIVPASYMLTVVTLTHTFRTRLGAELKAIANKNKAMGMFLRHVRIVDISDVAGAHATDAILAMCYAKTSHGRLLQQFGALESEGGRGMLLDALAVPDRHLDIVSAFSSADMDDERLHQAGPKMLKTVLRWAEQLDDSVVRPVVKTNGSNVLLNDLADRIRARGLNVAVDYGFDNGSKLPLVVGLNDKPFALAVLTDDAQFMGLQSTRERHRVLFAEHRIAWLVRYDRVERWRVRESRQGSGSHRGTLERPVSGGQVSVDEPSIQESAESGQSVVRVVSGYSATRRTARKHKRVVRQGTELFDADGVKLEPSDVLTERQRNADDDKRILGELPPHWGVFSEQER